MSGLFSRTLRAARALQVRIGASSSQDVPIGVELLHALVVPIAFVLVSRRQPESRQASIQIRFVSESLITLGVTDLVAR